MESYDPQPDSDPAQTADDSTDNQCDDSHNGPQLRLPVSRRDALTAVVGMTSLSLLGSGSATAQQPRTWKRDVDADGYTLFDLGRLVMRDSTKLVETARLGTTTDTVTGPLVLQIGDERALVLSPTDAGYAANLVGGHSSNSVADGARAATIAGGGFDDGSEAAPNTVGGDFGTVGGGRGNEVSGESATIGGGRSNRALAKFATIAGGGPGDPDSPTATNNRVFDDYGTIGGGARNRVGSDDDDSTTARFGTVSGGQQNAATACWATVGGGERNAATAKLATVGGGTANNATAELTTVGGGVGNNATHGHATIGGGSANNATDINATVGGGSANNATGIFATVGGGEHNDATENSATVGGGEHNGATARFATVGGGRRNTATARSATVGGGEHNDAIAKSATVAGGSSNFASGKYSFVTGRRAKTTSDGTADDGAVVFGDASETVAHSQGPNTFTSQMPMYAPAFNTTSARSKKTAIEPVEPETILDAVIDLEVSTWEFKHDGGTQHIGPMAGEFAEAFGLGDDEESIATVDADGVALAAIQGLAEQLDEKDEQLNAKDDRIADLEAESEKLRERCESLESRLESLEAAIAD